LPSIGAFLLSLLLQAAPSDAAKAARAELDAVKAVIQRLMDLRDQEQQITAQAREGTDDEKLKALAAKHQQLQMDFVALRDEAIRKMDHLLQAVSASIEKSPEDADLIEVRAEATLIYKQPAKALPDLEKLAALRPADRELLLKLGRLQHSVNRYEPARANLAKYLEKDAANVEARLLLCICDYATHEFAKAGASLEALEKEGKLDPQQAQQAGMFRKMAAATLPAWTKERELRAKEARADDLPRVKLTTSRGEVLVELFENEAPNTVANFIELAAAKFYDGLKFHRVIPGFMAQGGCPKGNGSGDAGYRFRDELQEGHRTHFRGSLSMANSGPDTNGSQFFITHLPTEWLNGKHTVFGRVIEGQAVVDGIEPGDEIVKAEVLRKRDHPYAVKKLPAEEDGIPQLKPQNGK
jgi:cyclophilin family peptidyl-prolyl cis-trans isomerase